MMDQLQEAYHAYQQALYHLPNPRVSVDYDTNFFFTQPLESPCLNTFFMSIGP